mmetsp:Transcript_33740/g.104176  ORF Transcript_33740/g.104176 Transcript_33740/m.104176 type:complete len:201 (-) Transcript_33740:16-618(-)
MKAAVGAPPAPPVASGPFQKRALASPWWQVTKSARCGVAEASPRRRRTRTRLESRLGGLPPLAPCPTPRPPTRARCRPRAGRWKVSEPTGRRARCRRAATRDRCAAEAPRSAGRSPGASFAAAAVCPATKARAPGTWGTSRRAASSWRHTSRATPPRRLESPTTRQCRLPQSPSHEDTSSAEQRSWGGASQPPSTEPGRQ